MNLIEWLNSNFTTEYGPFITAILLGIVWVIIYDFYHLLFSSVLSWFRK